MKHDARSTCGCTSRAQVELEDGEILEEPARNTSSRDREREARRADDEARRLAATAFDAAVAIDRAVRKERECAVDLRQAAEERERMWRKLQRVAKQRDAQYSYARDMFFAAARALHMPNDEAKQTALAACAANLRRMHDSRVTVQYGSGGRLPPSDGIW